MMKPLNSVLSFVITFVVVYIILVLLKPKFVMKTGKKGSQFNMGMALLWSLIIALVVGVIFMLIGNKKKSGFRYCSME